MNTGPWILGISASPHNGAVCLLRGDEIVVAIQEERLTRKKRDGIYAAYPCQALDYCFQYAGITAKDLSSVVYSIPGPKSSRTQNITLNPQLELARPQGVEVDTAGGVRRFDGASREDAPRIVADLVGAGERVYEVRVLRSTLGLTHDIRLLSFASTQRRRGRGAVPHNLRQDSH